MLPKLGNLIMKKTVRETIVLKKFSDVMDQYMIRVEEANKSEIKYCWCHDVWNYAGEIEEDYKAINLAMAKANRLEEMQDAAIENGRTEYATYLNEMLDVLVFEIHAIAGNPGPINCCVYFLE